MSTSDPRADESLVVCTHCDAVYRKVPLDRCEIAYCDRCGSELYRNADNRYRVLLPIVIACLIVFAICNAYPIVTMEIQGVTAQTTLWQAVTVLSGENMQLVALLVFATTIFFPLFEMTALLYVLVPLAMGRIPPGFGLVLRAMRIGRPWGMIEVFLLGIVAALVKLSTMAEVIPGIALWAFGVLTILLAVILPFDPKLLWDHAKRCEA
jgi:paraquat-inducible protein A